MTLDCTKLIRLRREKNLVKKSVFGEHPFLEFILKLIVILVDGTPEVVFG